jgi:hypothetical protein
MAMTGDTQQAIIDSLMETGMDVRQLADASGLPVGRVQGFLALENPSDTVAAARLLSVAVRARAVEWSRLT